MSKELSLSDVNLSKGIKPAVDASKAVKNVVGQTVGVWTGQTVAVKGSK